MKVSTSGCRARAFRRLLRSRAVRFSSALLGCLVACSAPDGSTLYQPLAPGGSSTQPAAGGSAGAAASAGGSSGAGASSDASSAGASGAGGTSAGQASSEGQGGSMLVSGDDGVAEDVGVDVGGAPGDGSDVGEGDVDAGPIGPGDEGDDVGEGDDVDVPPPGCIPAPEVCDGRDNDCDEQVDPGATCAAGCVGFTLGEHGYMYCAESSLRAAVLGRCEGEGMHLIWLETPEESEAVRDEIIANGLDAPPDNDEILTQIGGSDAAAEGEWFWVGNGAVAGSFRFWTGGSAAQGGAAVDGAHAPWSPGEPTGFANEHCAAMSVLGGAEHDPGAWDDRSCNELLPFVCESP